MTSNPNPNGENILQEMFRVVNKCGPWIKCYGGLLPRLEKFSIQIILEENSLLDAYLFISKDSGIGNSNYVQIPQDLECALFPVSRLITLSYTVNQLKLVFEDHQGMTLLFESTCQEHNLHGIETFVSQFRVCASVSKNSIEDDKLRPHNDYFLSKYNIPINDAQSRRYCDAFSIPTCVFPIIYDQDGAGETWIKRNRDLNASFFTEPLEITVCCYTWNVGEGGSPSEDPTVLKDLGELAEGNYDIYFFAFQEIDMSFQAVVSGNSPMTEEWTKCIRMAFFDRERKSDRLPPKPKEKPPNQIQNKPSSNPPNRVQKPINMNNLKQNPFNTMGQIQKQENVSKDQNPFNSMPQFEKKEIQNPFNNMNQSNFSSNQNQSNFNSNQNQSNFSSNQNPFNSTGNNGFNSNVNLNANTDNLISFDDLLPPPTSYNNSNNSGGVNELIDLTFGVSNQEQNNQNNFEMDFLMFDQSKQVNQNQNLSLNPNNNSSFNVMPNSNLNQNSNQNSYQNFDQYLNQNSNQNPNQAFNQNSNSNFNQNSNPNFRQNPNQAFNQNPNQAFNQNSNSNFRQNPNQTFNQNPNQAFNQNSNPNFRQSPNQTFNQNPNQTFNQNPNQNFYQNSNSNFNQSSNPNLRQNPNQSFIQNQNPYQNQNPNFKQNPNPNLNQNPNQNSNQNLNQSLNQNSSQNLNQNSNPNFNQKMPQQSNSSSNASPRNNPSPQNSNSSSSQRKSGESASSSKPATESKPTRSTYRMIYPTSLGGVYACILVREDFSLPISVETPKKVRLGLHGMTANKSAIVYPMKIGEFSRINFIGCHLTAHQGNVESRLSEMRELLRTNLTVQSRLSSSSLSTSSSSNIYRKFHSGIEKVDFIVLIGDLNFRINMSYEECLQSINNNDLEALISKDQLNEAKKTDHEIARFDEGPISFLPSYKFDKRSDVYDTSPKMRVPSYTDRILVVTNKNKKDEDESENDRKSSNIDDSDENIEDKFIFETDIIHDLFPKAHGLQSTKHFSSDLIPNEFPSKPKFAFYFRGTNQFSDHRPVQGILVFKVPKSIPDKLKKFEECQLKKMDEMSALAMPQVEPKSSQIRVGYNKRFVFKFKNTSVAWLHWKAFIEKKNDDDVINEINFSPTYGVVFPDQFGEIEINGLKKTKNMTRTIIIESNDKIPLAFLEVAVA